jgi:hypothetical protein
MWSVRRLYSGVYRIISAVPQFRSSAVELRGQLKAAEWLVRCQCSFDFYTVQEKNVRAVKITD